MDVSRDDESAISSARWGRSSPRFHRRGVADARPVEHMRLDAARRRSRDVTGARRRSHWPRGDPVRRLDRAHDRYAKDRPQAGWTVAASICGAIDALTRALAIELAPIRVNAVSPGVVRTPLWNNITDADRETFYRSVSDALPVGRVGEASDVAEAYLHLMRDAVRHGTGHHRRRRRDAGVSCAVPFARARLPQVKAWLLWRTWILD